MGGRRLFGAEDARKQRSETSMPVQVLMLALSPSMEKGNLAKWVKKEGDKVKAGAM